MSAEEVVMDDDDWEEWDGKSPFWHHCVAGSLAGLSEHTLVYPLDTVRTHIQVCASCRLNPDAVGSKASLKSARAVVGSMPDSKMGRWAVKGAATAGSPSQTPLPQGMLQTIRYLMSEPAILDGSHSNFGSKTTVEQTRGLGLIRLWRGVQTMLIGCIPAHAIYFSSYEIVKGHFKKGPDSNDVSWFGSMMAGAVAVMGHDSIMSPLDTVKQRLQLGHYEGSVSQALREMVQKESIISLYRSFPITLFANVPYGMIMVSTNEYIKQAQTPEGQRCSFSTTIIASSTAGFIASACTTPLDRVKTSLQTQQLMPACMVDNRCPQKKGNLLVKNWREAVKMILEREGVPGLFQGMTPRVLSHTPAVAISWTTYEYAKAMLNANF